jgi:hypothetical protein
MFDILPPIGTRLVLALLTVSSYWLAILLFRAVLRNHFVFATFRPAVASLMLLKFALGTECLKRLAISMTPVDTPMYLAMVRSGWIDDVATLFLLVALGSVFWTLAVAYPDVRNSD